MVTVVTFMLCILYHNETKKNKRKSSPLWIPQKSSKAHLIQHLLDLPLLVQDLDFLAQAGDCAGEVMQVGKKPGMPKLTWLLCPFQSGKRMG